MREKGEWWEVIFRTGGDSEEILEGLSNFLIEEGSEGLIWEDLSQQIKNGFGTTIKAYFKRDPSFPAKIEQITRYVKSLKEVFIDKPPVSFCFRVLKEKDWLKEFRESFRGTRVTEKISIIPSWEEKRDMENGDIIIVIEPGMAFGTGLHPSTRVAIEAIDESFKIEKMGSISLLDVGTGSGILAITAVKLGADEVIALDIDPTATIVARENTLRNGCHERIKIIAGTMDVIRRKFHIIVSNITERFHEENISNYWSLVKDGGWVIISGILTERAKGLCEKFKEIGFSPLGEKEMEGWSALIFRKDHFHF
jgi:ribosomal protein L11 methyltransferase